MERLLIATKNKNKYIEVVEILTGLDFEFCSLLDYPDIKSVEETGESFKKNAQIKARAYSKKTNLLSITDDSGLVVDKLEGRPGVFSSRFAGENATYAQNNEKLLFLLKDVPWKERKAKFVCYIAIAKQGEVLSGCTGQCKGYIAFEPMGNSGFGYDPLFIPQGYDKTFAQLGAEKKNRLSHRYKALVKAKDILKGYLV